MKQLALGTEKNDYDFAAGDNLQIDGAAESFQFDGDSFVSLRIQVGNDTGPLAGGERVQVDITLLSILTGDTCSMPAYCVDVAAGIDEVMIQIPPFYVADDDTIVVIVTSNDATDSSVGAATWMFDISAQGAIVENKLDHLVAVADSDDVVNDSIMAKLASKAATADWSDYDNTIHSQEALADEIVAGGSIIYTPTDGTINVGSGTDEDFVNCATDDGSYWEIGEADGSPTIDVTATISMGSNRKATGVAINGYFNRDGGGGYVVEIYVRNYTTPGNDDWDKLSAGTAATEMRDRSSDMNYLFALASYHTCPVDNPGTGDVKGDVQIRFKSTRETYEEDNDTLYLDHIGVAGVSMGAVSPEIIADAVWIRSVEDVRDGLHYRAGHLLKALVCLGTEVAAENSKSSFTLSEGTAVADAYVGMSLLVRDESSETRDVEVRRIIGWTADRVVTVDRDFSFTPTHTPTADHVHILGPAYGNVNTTSIADKTAIAVLIPDKEIDLTGDGQMIYKEAGTENILETKDLFKPDDTAVTTTSDKISKEIQAE